MADTACMGLVIAQIIGRWGDFFNRESFGEYTNSIFAMQLPLSAVRSSEVTSVMRENLETIGGVSYIQVHPVFLYESLWCLLLFLLMLVWKRKKRFHGEVFLRYLAGYGLGRFILEYLRTDKLTIPGTSIGICQVISAALFLICAVVVTVESSMAKKRAARRRRRREQDYEAQEMAARQAEAEEYRDRLKLERAFADEKKGSVRKHIPAVFRSMKARKKKALRMIQRKKRLPDQLLTRWKKLQRMVMKKSLKIRKQLLAKTLRLKKQLRKNTKKMKAMKPYLRKHFRKTAAYKKTIPPMKRWKRLLHLMEQKLLLQRIHHFQKMMSGCIASRADLRKNLPMSRKIDGMIARYHDLAGLNEIF